jgi:3-(3-hydroxy-phenyl)propionate hydroxylase
VLAPANVAALLRLYGTDEHAFLRRKVIYTFHARMAARWRDRRVLLAGDAAHLMPPFAGQGMNSGVRDAHNLAWKLAAVMSGQLGPNLLDSYEVERRHHTAQMIQLAIRMGHVMMPGTRLRAFGLQAFFRALALFPAARSYFAEMKYKPRPSFDEGFLLQPEEMSRSSLVGKLFPQALVMTDSGYHLLDDVIGDGFALLAPPGTSPSLLEEVNLSGIAPLHKVAVFDKEEAPPAESVAVVARDARGDLARLLEGRPSGLFLLRPDRYVAAFLAADRIGPTSNDIATLVGSTWPPLAAMRTGDEAGCHVAE